MSKDSYINLIAGLPATGDLFKAKQTPLSRLNLDQRLRVLSEEDAITIAQLETLTRWIHQTNEQSDHQFIAKAKSILALIDNAFAKQLILDRLNFRTVVVALRKRQRGEGAPQAAEEWGLGAWPNHIRKYWNEPYFRLENVYRWLPEASRLISEDKTIDLEKLLLHEVWKRLDFISEDHYFDIEAVIIYVMRWDIISRWTNYSSEKAVERFRDLVSRGLKNHTLEKSNYG